jgi:exodeoxyribonuclease III
MKILSWNIRQGGGSRVGAIVAAIASRNPEVVVLTEYRETKTRELERGLYELGLTHQAHSSPGVSHEGILIASKQSFNIEKMSAPPEAVGKRWLEVFFHKRKFTLAGTYVPVSGAASSAKGAFWRGIHAAAERRREDSFLLVGDFNSGYAAIDAESGSLSCEEYFLGMREKGFVDVWRHKNRCKTEYTWFSTGARNGFRIDHAFASLSMLRRIRDCHFEHELRAPGLSDHAGLWLQVH